MKTSGYFAFAILLLLIIVMGWATWQEHLYGSEHAMRVFYRSPWFNLLWLWLALIGGYYLMQTKVYKKPSVFLIHCALLVMLAGAMITRFCGQTGWIHLREGIPAHTFIVETSGRTNPLPFSLELKTFRVEYYPGTATPLNYISIVSVKDLKSEVSTEKEISMNNILQHKGFRFYQSSFDEDMKGSVLSVNSDAAGIAFTYSGYGLLFLSMIWILFDKRKRFVQLVGKQRLACFAVLMLAGSLAAFTCKAAALMTDDGLTLSRELADRFAIVKVNYHGRICPLQTLAMDFTTKLTGKPKYRSLTPEQVLLGWMLFPKQWEKVPMFKLQHPELKAQINASGEACLADFFDADGVNKLDNYRKSMYRNEKQSAFMKEVIRLDERIQLIAMLHYGDLLKLFPIRTSEGVNWLAPSEISPEDAAAIRQLSAKDFFPLMSEFLRQDKKEEAAALLASLLHYQQNTVGAIAPSEERLKAELLNNRIPLFSLLFMSCLTIGSVGLLLFLLTTSRSRIQRTLRTLFYALLVCSFCLLTAGIALRSYIAGRLPVSNSYETLLFIAWIALLVGVLLKRSPFLISVFSLLLAGFTLLTAHIGIMNPRITPLMPVLQSPLLNIHVLLIMASYGLCGFMALNSVTSCILYLCSKKKFQARAQLIKMKERSELLMFPATFLMGAGIFIGAIWANISWGRYWGWDPKEVWALITFLLMSFTFHGKTLKCFRNPLFYHLFVLIIFAAVLMTYFGVNYILGGRHSYAGN
ncbi:MAG: cytochrome c biogenesis protein CcsA [Dysgonamonadaceae bacterium]|jgi:ABC-type transport system involved in cytochrome c biogenesis permease subunit|nr:cytochrome c biogenesis protein CcsA [Dysgonamonadaceae bacterium]